MKPDRRVPTLADRFCARRWSASERVIDSTTMSRLQQRTREARRYVFDEQAAERLAHVVRTIPELLVREHRFARAPYDLTWIEFPHWKYFEVLTAGRPEVREMWAEGTADHTIGYLIDHGRVIIVSGGITGKPMDPPIVTPFQYHLHTEWPLEGQIAFAERAKTSRGQIDRYLWGSSVLDIPAEEIRALRERHRLDLLPMDARFAKLFNRNMMDRVLRGGSGELRNIIAILLMLNRPTICRYRNETPASRGFHKGKLIPYLSHTVVNVDLDAVPTLRLIGTAEGEGVPRRAHEVEGHYCHDVTARDFLRIAGCIHEWVDHNEEWTPWPNAPANKVHHWKCVICGGKRWWRKKHQRGDATLGFVVHDRYAVTASDV